MNTVRVATATPYDVLVEKGLRHQVGSLIAVRFGTPRVFVTGDINAMQLWGGEVTDALRAAGLVTFRHQFAPGEASKTLETVAEILAKMKECDLTRTDMVLALGGGITGDMAGLAAALYQRGTRVVQMPSTLLAMVDASIGGKTGVNLDGLKNQIGTFWQPSLVVTDPELLSTLPPREFACGMAEVVKYGCIRDPEILDLAARAADPSGVRDYGVITGIIAACAAVKAEVVARDERDNGLRMILNFGHTVGHAVEKCTAGEVRHGEAVAIGMVSMARTAERMGMVSREYTEELCGLLTRLNLPVECPAPREDIIGAIAADKKRDGGVIRLVLPSGRGTCEVLPFRMSDLPGILVI